MSFIQKAFKVTLIPTHNQEVLINKTIGCARYVYNRFLAHKIEFYTSEGKTLNYNACSQQLTLLKKEIEWLKEVDKFALQNSLKNLETAYKNFFADLKKVKGKKGVGFPKFKKRHGCKSISDASWAKFITMLEYKALWHDRLVQKVGTFYPSSQTCNCCGFINPLVKDLKLREWSCPGCNNYNLRDKNAALNILSEGLRLLTAVGTPEVIKNACGELVSLEVIQAERDR